MTKPVYAVADVVPEGSADFLTAGKQYKTISDSECGFWVVADDGEEHCFLWNGCAHLDGGNWRRIEGEGADTPVTLHSTLDTLADEWDRLASAIRGVLTSLPHDMTSASQKLDEECISFGRAFQKAALERARAGGAA